jgi:hypothetical protein
MEAIVQGDEPRPVLGGVFGWAQRSLNSLIRIAGAIEGAHSDAKRPLIPIQSGHRFRFKAATDSDAKRPVRLGL